MLNVVPVRYYVRLAADIRSRCRRATPLHVAKRTLGRCFDRYVLLESYTRSIRTCMDYRTGRVATLVPGDVQVNVKLLDGTYLSAPIEAYCQVV